MIKALIFTYRNAFSGLPRQIWVLAVAVLINRMGTMVMSFFTLYLTQELGLSVSTAGILLAFFGGGALFGSYGCGILCQHFRAKEIQLLTLVLSAFCFLILLYQTNLAIIGMLLFFCGLFIEGFRPANAVSVANTCHPDLHPKAFSLIYLAINIGMAIGPVLGGILALYSYRLLFFIDAITCILAAIFLYLMFREPELHRQNDVEATEKKGSGFTTVWKDGLFITVILLMCLTEIVFRQFSITLPLYLKSFHGFMESDIGFIYFLNTTLIILFQMVISSKIRTQSLIPALALGCLLLGLGFGIIPLGHGFVIVVLAVTILTFGEITYVPALSTFTAKRSSVETRGAYMGLQSMTYGVSFMLAPLIGTWVYALNPYWCWYGAGLIGFGLSMTFLVLAAKAQPENKKKVLETAYIINE